MKIHFRFFLPGLFLLSVHLDAQSDYSGQWNGAIELPGMNLELAIELKNENGTWAGDLDIPVQQIRDMKLGDLKIEGRNMSFRLPEVPANASFSGAFDEKSEKLEGSFSQGGMAFPMKLTRASAAQKMMEEKRRNEAITSLRLLVDSLRRKLLVPGLALGMIYNGNTVLAEGYGWRDLDKKLPVTANTQFAIGSSTKAFTSACLALLADDGLLDWEKPVIEYMPDFRLYDEFAARAMNATDLVCHRSGMPRHDYMWYGSRFSRKEIFDRLRYLPSNRSFRSAWQYNNLMFMIAGCLTERISGISWEDFLKKRIFQPLGMSNTGFSVKEMASSKDAATGYRTKDRKENIRMEYCNLDAIGPAGSINASLNDMLKWVQLQLNEGKVGETQVISASEMAHMHSPQMLMDGSGAENNPEITDPSYGLGWFLFRYKGLQIVEHGGNIDGFSALVYMVPEKEFGLVVLTNQDGSGLPMTLARYATDLMLGLPPTDWYARAHAVADKQSEAGKESKKTTPKRIAGTSPSHTMDAYTGEYEHPGYGTVEVKQEGGKLRLRFNSFDLPLEHWHYDVFRASNESLDIHQMLVFQSDVNGVIGQLSTSMDPFADDVVFKKTPPRRLLDPVFLQRLAGKYQLDPGDTPIHFELRNKTLYLKVPGQPEYTLEPFQGTEFKLKGLNGYSISFEIDAQDKITGAAFNQPEGVFRAKRAD